MSRISASYLREIFDYNYSTGRLYWAKPRPKIKVGTRAGTKHPNGYRYVKINQRSCREHRLIWIWVTGQHPKKDIDHKNGKRDDNRFVNLREATRAQNAANARARKAAGLKGTSRYRNGKWFAQIAFNKQKIALGTFDTTEQAHAAYVAKAKELYGEFARAR